MSKTSTKERRSHHRHPTRLTVQGTPDDGGVVARMVARNLSLGGLYCISNADFPEMTRLAVRIMLPAKGTVTQPLNGDAEPLDVEAVVVRRERIDSASGADRFELALYFTGLEAAAKRQLERFLSD